MKKDQKNKRVLEIADELHELGSRHNDNDLVGFAVDLRKLVASKKTTNEQSTEDEPPPTGGGNPPSDKGKPDKP